MDAALASAAYLRNAERWPALSVVVLELDEFVLQSDMERSRQLDMSSFATRLGLDVWDLPSFGREPERLWWRLQNLLSGRGTLLTQPDFRYSLPAVLQRNHRTKEVFASVSPAPAPVVFDRSKGAARVKFIEGLKRANIDDNVQAFAGLVRELRRRGIRVVFLTVPTHEAYTVLRPPEWDELLRRAADQAQKAAGGEIPWWQLRSDPRFADEVLFQNLDHLNREGARELAKVLKPRLESVLSDQ